MANNSEIEHLADFVEELQELYNEGGFRLGNATYDEIKKHADDYIHNRPLKL